jgi:hypothetical protein
VEQAALQVEECAVEGVTAPRPSRHAMWATGMVAPSGRNVIAKRN